MCTYNQEHNGNLPRARELGDVQKYNTGRKLRDSVPHDSTPLLSLSVF